MTERDRQCKAEFARLIHAITDEVFGGSLTEFGRHCGVHRTAMSNYGTATNNRYPTIEVLEAMMSVVGPRNSLELMRAHFNRYPEIAKFVNPLTDPYTGEEVVSEEDACCRRLSALSEHSLEAKRFLVLLNRTAFRERN